jgi:hypothetical protein
MYRVEELIFMSKASYVSISILTTMNFMYFGVFMVLGLNYVPQYFQYLTITAVNCFLQSIVTNKMAYYFFIAQHTNHPRINAQGWASPRVRFYVILILLQLLVYVAGFQLIRYTYFSYFAMAFFIYPIIHVMAMAKKSNRNSFRW